MNIDEQMKHREEQMEKQREHNVLVLLEQVDGKPQPDYHDRTVNLHNVWEEGHDRWKPPYQTYHVYGRVFDSPNTFRHMVVLARNEEDVEDYALTQGIGFRSVKITKLNSPPTTG
jgi:hypothetical protein